MSLQFRDVDELAFIGCEYKATVYWMKGNKMVTGLAETLEVELLYEDMEPVKNSATIVCLASKRLRISRPVQLSYHFKDSSLHHDNKKFRLRARATGKFAGTIAPVVSKPISVIKHKLHIENELPKQFFKDQGGRERRMEVQVQLTDGRGQPVRLPKPMPLITQLRYENTHAPVPNQQEILNMKDIMQPQIGRDGRAKILFRIEEVSSRHQRQNFELYIAPDVERCPLNGDVLAAYSSAVTVRSKATGKTNRKRPRKIEYPTPGITPQIGKCMEDVMAASKRVRLDACGSVTDAIKDLIHWSTHTCDMLRSIQSQHIGYGINSDGSPNLGLKTYRCPSCWVSSCGGQNNHTPDCALNKVLNLYRANVAPGIAHILKSIEGQALHDVRQPEPVEPLPDALEPEHNQFSDRDNQDPVVPPQLPPPRPVVDRFNSRDSFAQLLGAPLGPGALGRVHSDVSVGSITSMFDGVASPLADFSCYVTEGEHRVHYVYKKHFHNGQTNLGYPAFDKRYNLSGFFSQNTNSLAVDESMEYLGLSQLDVHPNKVHQVEKEFKKNLMSAPNSKDFIKCVADYTDINQMKQNLLRPWPPCPTLSKQNSK